MAKRKPRSSLLLRGSDAKWEMMLDVKATTAALGVDVLANFYRCFAAADRLVALEHLMVLNVQNLDRDGIASERNMHHLVLLLAAAMYEAGNALQKLTSSSFGQTLQKLRGWKPLTKMRKEWNTDVFAGTIRNNLGHHFGSGPAYTAGIAAGRRRTVLESGEGNLLINSRFVAPWNALFAGLGITRRQMRKFVKKTRDAHTKYSSLVRLLFHETLVSHDLIPAS